MSRKPSTRSLAYRNTMGSWFDIAYEDCLTLNGEKYSNFDLVLRKQYKDALEGKFHAIKG